MTDLTQMTALERAATQANIGYVKFGGNIHCMTNGAGMGMAIMDYISEIGGELSSLTDFGGKTYHEQIQFVFDMFGMDDTSKVLLLMSYGGLTDMQITVALLTDAIKKGVMNGKPVIVRIKGVGSDSALEELKKWNETCEEN